MESFNYTIPESLKEHKLEVEATVNKLIKTFNSLCRREEKRIEEEVKLIKAQRKYFASVETLPEGDKIIKMVSNCETPFDDNIRASLTFKIINNVLFHTGKSNGYKCSYSTLNNLLPLGLVEEDYLDKIIDMLNCTTNF